MTFLQGSLLPVSPNSPNQVNLMLDFSGVTTGLDALTSANGFVIGTVICHTVIEAIFTKLLFQKEPDSVLTVGLTMLRIICARGLAIVPALFIATSLLGFIVTYTLAVANNHVYAFFPTISESGIYQPERNFFTLFISMASFLGILTIIIRYLQTRYLADGNHYDSQINCVNIITMLIGFASCFGSLMVASFQGSGWSVTGHMTGAALTFGGGVVYCWFQCLLTARMVQYGIVGKCILILRTTLACLSSIVLITCISLMHVSYELWEEKYKHKTDYEHWEPKDPGYVEHVISASSEWITAILLLMFFGTFCPEFQKIGVELKVKRRDPTFLPFYSSSTDLEAPLV